MDLEGNLIGMAPTMKVIGKKTYNMVRGYESKIMGIHMLKILFL
jgi:hypothetical protein